MFETLESRRLMSVVTLASNTDLGHAGALTIRGGSPDNNFTVVEDNGFVRVTDNTTNTEQDFFGVTALTIRGNSGNDTILFNGNSLGANIDGDQGADQLIVGDQGTGSSSVNGGAGNDLLYSTISHNTTLDGGSGDDFIAINGGRDVDPEEFDYINAETFVVCSSGSDIVQVWAGVNTINGGSGSDLMIIIGDQFSTNTYTNIENVTIVPVS